MAITKKIQFLRNNTIYTGADGAAARNAAIAGMRGIATGSTTSGDIVDGQAILARYNAAGSASTGDVQTIYGIVHKGVNGKTGVTIYESAELLWAAINQCALSSTTVTAGTGLSGGSQLSASTVTIRHNTGNVTTVTDQATTTITNRTFNAVTAVTDDGMGHMSMIKLAKYQLPDNIDSATTQSGYTDTTARPILLKNGTGTASTTAGVAFVTAATIDGSGNFSAKTSVSSPSISATTVSGGTVKGVTVSATTYENLPVDPDTAMTQTGMGSLATGNYPILTKMDTTNSAVTSGAYFANNVTVNNAGDLSAKTSVKTASIVGSTGVSGGTFSGGSLTVTGGISGNNVSANTISAATHIKSPTISGGSVTASGNIRGGNVSADTISAATHVKAPTISATSAYGATISGGTYKGLPVASSTGEGIVKVVEITGTATGSTVMSQSAVTEAISAALVDVADALVYKGTVSGQSTSPGASLPKADKGDVYKVAVSGYVAGQKVEVGDMFICNTDNTASGTASTNWDVIQNNIDISDISTTSPLSGGGNVTSGPVTIAHKTITTNSVLPVGDPTQISDGGQFTAVTSIDTDGYGHPTYVRSTAFKLPTDSKVTQEQFTGSTSNPIIIKVDNGTSASARNKVYFSSAATIDKTGNIKTTGNVSAATFSGGSLTVTGTVKATGNISGATFSGSSLTVTGTATAKDVTASTSVKSPTISGTTVKGVTISATTYENLPVGSDSAVTQTLYEGGLTPILVKTTNDTATTTDGVSFVTGATVTSGGSMVTKAIRTTDLRSSATTDADGNITADGWIYAGKCMTASGYVTQSSASTASSEINASILLSNGRNTNIIDCGTY